MTQKALGIDCYHLLPSVFCRELCRNCTVGKVLYSKHAQASGLPVQYKDPQIRTTQRTHHRRFLQQVDAEAVDNALYGWLQSLSGQDSAIAIDGKTLLP